jgi:signal transduction histidine kinase
MAKLYQRGARLKNSPTAGEPTSGYGLAVAKDLAEQLRGSIECSSTPGVGTSFTLELPTTASV